MILPGTGFSGRPTLVVSGALANKPFNGGEAWVRLSWIRGFQKLGYDVYFVEQIDPDSCIDDAGRSSPLAESANFAFFRRVVERYGLAGHAALVSEDGEQIFGATWPELLTICEGAELLVNISGHLSLRPLIERFRLRAYIDIDPGFTQIWHVDPETAFHLKDHDFYFTIGENIGNPVCPIPTAGIEWSHVRQPVVLDDWTVSPAPRTRRFTTLANWRGVFGPVQHEGRAYGLKVHEFRKIIELPRRSECVFELALAIHDDDDRDRENLRRHGWRLVDALAASRTPEAFQRYIHGSAAEFSVAQGIYVDTRSGWFSDRTVRYLAAGRPALVQDTGFSRNLPVGDGLIGFGTLDEAVVGAAEILARYERHSRAARALAEEYFDSDRVLRGFVETVGIAHCTF